MLRKPAAIVVVGLLGGCGAKDAHAPTPGSGGTVVRAPSDAAAPIVDDGVAAIVQAAPDAAPKPLSTCVPTDAVVDPNHTALRGASLDFCFVTSDANQYCFTTDLATKTIVPVSASTVISVGGEHSTPRLDERATASIEPSARGK